MSKTGYNKVESVAFTIKKNCINPKRDEAFNDLKFLFKVLGFTILSYYWHKTDSNFLNKVVIF